MENKKYPIELEVVTPLSVGAGNDNDWIRGTDFIQKMGKVYVLDFQKMAASGVDVSNFRQAPMTCVRNSGLSDVAKDVEENFDCFVETF